MANKQKRIRRTPEEARALILDAAEKSMAAEGPAGIRLQDVAQAAGVSHPTILHHFGSREGLVRALNLRTLEDLRAALVATMGEARSGDNSITRTFAAFRGGLAQRIVWLLQAADQVGGRLETFEAIVESLHAVRQRIARPGVEVDLADTRAIVHLTTVTALGDALIGPRMRQSAGEPEETGRARFEKWYSDLLELYIDSKT